MLRPSERLLSLQTMHRKVLLLVLLGLLSLSLAPVSMAQDEDVEDDDLGLDLAGTEDDEELEEEAPPASTPPAAPKVGRPDHRTLRSRRFSIRCRPTFDQNPNAPVGSLCSGDLQGSRTHGGTLLCWVVWSGDPGWVRTKLHPGWFWSELLIFCYITFGFFTSMNDLLYR